MGATLGWPGQCGTPGFHPWVRSLSWEGLLEEGMAAHSSILAWRMPMDRRARQATVHGVTGHKGSDTTKVTKQSTLAKELLDPGGKMLGLWASPSLAVLLSPPRRVGTRALAPPSLCLSKAEKDSLS